ncbi:MmcB family DNA repair protein [Azospirillum tabaci]|uniref:MmcB family DNA repair protein n=1 Tax=Azospirillum tabaci TaxID=2752310 RepID=UPI001B3BD7B5|nr:MmcB family DNA repair protein [Azospirillum tabaci]
MTDLLSPIEWKHDALADDLAAHLAGDRLIFTNMQLGPSGSVRPDVYAIPMVYSRFTPLAYECKVSVADFRADVTSGKWQSYLPYASQVIFAVPVGLVGKDAIPPGCGLMVRGPNGWRTLKAPTLRPIENLPLEVWQKLLFDALGRLEERRRLQPRIAHDWKARDVLAREVGKDVAAVFQRREEIAKAAEEIFKLLGKARPHSFGKGESYRDEIWHVRELAHAVKQAIEVWTALAGVLGIESDWPDYLDVQRVQTAINKLNPLANAKTVREALDQIGRALERAQRDLLPDAAADAPKNGGAQ